MEIQELKQYIIDNDKIETILSSLGCHHIVDKGSYLLLQEKFHLILIIELCGNILLKAVFLMEINLVSIINSLVF